MSDDVMLLGVAAAADAGQLATLLARIPGPPVTIEASAGLVAVAQTVSEGFLARATGTLKRDLTTLQARLEAACLHGPFLAAEPAAARLGLADIGPLLTADAAMLAQALAHHGARHQWELVLRWVPERVLEGRREAIKQQVAAAGGGRTALGQAIGAALAEEQAMRSAALAEAMSAVVVAMQPGQPGSETEARLSVLIEHGTERLLEGALAGLPAQVTDGASADLRGPMPPVNFAALRVLRPDAAACVRAWDALGLPTMIEPNELPALYRRLAYVLHPDRAGMPDAAAASGTGNAGAPMAEVADAYRLLRGITASHRGPLARADLTRLARPRLALNIAAALAEATGDAA
jgi:hypothetical protein